MPKKISALIRGSVSSIPQIMRVIPCRQIFGIFRAWTMVSPHEEGVACSLGPKGHGHRMPKNISAQIRGKCETNTWKYESDPLQSDFWHIQSLDKDVFAWWTSNLQIIAKGHGRRMALKKNSALIGGSVWQIPEFMRVICCNQIFSIFRAWTRTISHNEQVACYLGQKGHGHRMPKNISAQIGGILRHCLMMNFSPWLAPEVTLIITGISHTLPPISAEIF